VYAIYTIEEKTFPKK